jgi:hypothetical protein
MKWTACYVVRVCILAGTFMCDPLCFADDAENDMAPGAIKNLMRVDDIHPVQGPCGSRHGTTFVVGEQLHFVARMSGISMDSGGHCDYDYSYSITDPTGRNIDGCSMHVPTKDLLCLGGSTSTIYFSVNTDMSAAPGQYTLKFVALDNLSKETVTRELKVDILDRATFSILNASLYRDRECSHGSSGIFTLGEDVYMRCDIRVPRDKDRKASVDVSAAIFDQDNRVVRQWESERRSADNIDGGGIQFFFQIHSTIADTGVYRVRVKAYDASTKKTKVCDLPFVVRVSPGTNPAIANPATSRSRGAVAMVGDSDGNREPNPLSIDVYPTLGELGSYRDGEFICGEKVLFFAMLRGLSVIEDQRGKCALEVSLLDSRSRP